MSKIIKLALFSLLGLSVAACVPKASNGNTETYFDSPALTNNIKTKLIQQLGEQGSRIHVKAYRDEVQLTGIVDTAIAQQKAGEIAASVGQIRQVRNDVLVK